MTYELRRGFQGNVGTVVDVVDQDGRTSRAILPAVMPPFQVSAEASGTFTPNAAPAINTAMHDGVLTIETGLSAGAVIRITDIVLLIVAATITTSNNFVGHVFSEEPTATITQNSVPTWTAADAAAKRASIAVNAQNAAGGTALDSIGQPTNLYVPVDESGSIYLVLTSNAAQAYATPGVATWRLNYLKS